MKKILLRVLIGCALILWSFNLGYAWDSSITFDNQSGEDALVKLIPYDSSYSVKTVTVKNKSQATINDVGPGKYYRKVRYGQNNNYRYTRGQDFSMEEFGLSYSIVKITLHPVVGGNYKSHPIDAAEFNK